MFTVPTCYEGLMDVCDAMDTFSNSFIGVKVWHINWYAHNYVFPFQ